MMSTGIFLYWITALFAVSHCPVSVVSFCGDCSGGTRPPLHRPRFFRNRRVGPRHFAKSDQRSGSASWSFLSSVAVRSAVVRKSIQNGRYFNWFSAVPSSNETVFDASTDAATLQRQAEEWRCKARAIMEEVQQMEAELRQTRSSSQKVREETTTELIERLFHDRSLTPEAVAQVLRDEKWTVEEAEMALTGLFSQAYGQASGALQNVEGTQSNGTVPSTPAGPMEPSDSLQPSNSTDAMLLETKMECLIKGAEILDEIALASKEPLRRWSGRVGNSLRARRNELRRIHEQTQARQFAASRGLNQSSTMSEGQIYASSGFGGNQSSGIGDYNVSTEQVSIAPYWVPSTVYDFLSMSSSRVENEDVTTIKEKILPGTAFFCTSSETCHQAAIFRGNIRGLATEDRNSTAGVLAQIQQRLDDAGLSQKIQLLLLPDPEWRPSRDHGAVQEPPRPVILAIPADVVPDEQKIRRKTSFIGRALKVTAAVVPVLTTFLYSITCFALNPSFFDAVMNQRNLRVLTACLPLFVGVVAVQTIHELAHALIAKRWGMKIGLPFPLPSFQVGTFGCITPLKSFPQNRSALLDFALSGPVSAMIVSIGMMVAGIRLTLAASGSDILRFPVLPIAVLKSSFLAGCLLALLAPKSMTLAASHPLAVHPLFMAGFAGLLSSSLNMLPIFRLDGGRACSAAMGSRFAAVASSGTIVFMFSLALSSTTGVAFAWCALVLLFQRRFEIPARDELTDVNDFRLVGWIASLATAILALSPFPGGSTFM